MEALIANSSDIRAVDNNGFTPLHMAAYNGHREVVELLISQGADVIGC